MHSSFGFLLLWLFAGYAPLQARVALLVAEPFGKFGAFTPTGHAAIYLSRVCADTPTRLRLCRPEEHGVVISRYNRIGGYDWLAVPLLPYLYAVEEPADVPASADAAHVAALRDGYRRSHLSAVAPDGSEGETPAGDWIQLAGASYDRTIYGFSVETTQADDERLIASLNSQRNRRRFHLLYRNCADFAHAIVNFYYPGALRRSIVADLGITTPKHSAKSLVGYGRRRPELMLAQFEIPQVEGSRRSTRLRGVSESLVRSKKYVVPLAILQPWVAGTAAVAYLTRGRFNPSRRSPMVCEPQKLPACVLTAGPARPDAAAE